MTSLTISSITLDQFNEILARYENTVPEQLRDLDSHRYNIIPAALAKRQAPKLHLTKDEVVKLVEWKLYVV